MAGRGAEGPLLCSAHLVPLLGLLGQLVLVHGAPTGIRHALSNLQREKNPGEKREGEGGREERRREGLGSRQEESLGLSSSQAFMGA
eukprot:3432886-Rhodomonas_salina.2